jgi:ribosomal protein L37AE/L43A
MVEVPGSRGQRDPNVIRLSHQYVACPSCQLILPLYDDPDGWPGDHAGAAHPDAVPPSLQVARCGLCKRPLETATPWPLELKLRCPDCGALIRAPTQAAVLVCSGCDSYFANPGNSPEVGQRSQRAHPQTAHYRGCCRRHPQGCGARRHQASTSRPDPRTQVTVGRRGGSRQLRRGRADLLLCVRAAAASIAARLITSLVAEGWSADARPTDGTDLCRSALGPCRNGRVWASAVISGH